VRAAVTLLLVALALPPRSDRHLDERDLARWQTGRHTSVNLQP
jgi:hypothetical protein